VALRHATDDIAQIGLGIEPSLLGGFQHGIKDRGALAACVGAEEEKILSRQSYAPQGTLRRIVVDADPAVLSGRPTAPERI